MKYKLIVLLITIFATMTSAFSQLDSSLSVIDSLKQDSINNIIPNQTKFSIQSGNNIVQVGQAMETNEIYLRPGVMYYHKSGIYLGASLTMMPTDKQRPVDNYYLNLGYDFDLGKNFSTGIDYSFSHYYSSKQTSSSAGHMIRPYLSWDTKLITPTLTPIILLGTTKDYALQFDLTHVFIFKNIFNSKDKLSIPISIGAIGGTSEYYTSYTNIIKKGKGKPVTTTVTGSQLALTSIYSMATIKYKLKSTAISFNTSYYHSTDPNSSVTNTPVYKLILAYYL